MTSTWTCSELACWADESWTWNAVNCFPAHCYLINPVVSLLIVILINGAGRYLQAELKRWRQRLSRLSLSPIFVPQAPRGPGVYFSLSGTNWRWAHYCPRRRLTESELQFACVQQPICRPNSQSSCWHKRMSDVTTRKQSFFQRIVTGELFLEIENGVLQVSTIYR